MRLPSRHQPADRWLPGVAGIALTLGMAAVPPAPASAQGTNWPVYHEDPAGQGVAASVSLTSIHKVWKSPKLDGELYGEPLVEGSTVVVATENDTVYALNVAKGTVLWSTHLGTPVPASKLPCGDIKPTVGITGTPVIDESLQEVFVVADEFGTSGPKHMLAGLSLANGTVLFQQDVDPPGAKTSAILQRTALNLDDGNVVFGYGGNSGDCSTYHGWIVSVPESGTGTVATFEADSGAGEDQGAVWMGGGGPEVDANGDIWFADGNGSVTNPASTYDDSDGVLELSSSLQLLQYFAPATWATDNAHDLDLGSSSPALLSNGYVVQAGKSQIAFLLSQADLGGVGGQVKSLASVCGANVDGGTAVDGNVVYLPCQAGLIAVTVGTSPPSLTVDWQASGVSCPPIVAGGLVWSMSESGTVDGLNPSTGAVEEQVLVGTPSNHFPTPSVGDNLLLVPGKNHVFAFAGA